jgi:hypothetical protein
MTSAPLLTIGVISCNRLRYLRALLESARRCLDVSRYQFIVVDNASIEDGLRDYVTGLDFVEHKVFRPARDPKAEAVRALNTITELARARHVLHLSDDVQFVVKGDRWADSLVEIAERNPGIGSLMPLALRRVTLERYFGGLASRLWPRAFPKRVANAAGDARVILFRRGELGVAHSCFGVTAVDTWRRLGPWRTLAERQSVQDAGSGAEEDLVLRFRRSGLRLRKALAQQPVLAEIITDMRGTQARVRGNRRYGRYLAPPEGTFYYRIWDESELARFRDVEPAVAFEDIVEPLGFELPYDAQGNRLKNPLGEGDPFEWIHPSLAGQDL